MSEKKYSIGQISEMLGISISTLRYYDKQGLLPLVERTNGNIRVFSELDVNLLNMIDCLKNTGLQLKDIKTYFEWCYEGDSTIDKRYDMILDRKAETERQIAILQKSLSLINYKCEYYRKAKEAGTTNLPELNNSSIQEGDNKANQFFQDAVGSSNK